MQASSSSTLGFLLWTIGLTAISIVAQIVGRWYGLHRKQADSPWQTALEESFWPSIFTVAGFALLILAAWFLFLALAIYKDHQQLVTENSQLLIVNTQLSTDLEWRKHNVSTTDAVFPNMIYMLQAFHSFKGEMNGSPCVLYFSAPKETQPLASVIAQLAGPLSGCSPFGPASSNGRETDDDEELTQGIVLDAIVVHAKDGERAADGLFSTLGNQIKLQRSHKLLKHPERRWAVRNGEHVVWLQFGPTVKWNSELR